MGMTVANAVGKQLTLWQNKGTIIGVVKDFNYKPIQQPIEPMIIGLNRWGGTAIVRVTHGELAKYAHCWRKFQEARGGVPEDVHNRQMEPTHRLGFGRGSVGDHILVGHKSFGCGID